MANKPIVLVNVSLQTSTVSQKGFGTPLFIAAHHNFKDRIRSYSSLTAVGDDFVSTDNAYIAAEGIFSSSPSPATFKVGRREAVSVVTPTDVADGTIHAFTIEVNDGDTISVSVTTGAAETAADVATAMKAAIDSFGAVSAHVTTVVVGAGAAGTLTIAPTIASDVFGLSGLSAVDLSTNASAESATDALAAIFAEDDQFYFVTAEDHTETFVLALATAVQAQTMLYFVSTQEQASITSAYSVASTDIQALLVQASYSRTAGMWSQTADTNFPECNYVGVNAPWAPDQRAVVWDGRELAGVVVSKNAQGNALTGTQEKNLFDRNCSYVTETAAGLRVLGGKVASGKYIDEIRIMDNVVARATEGLQSLILNQQGGKIGGGAAGKAQCASAVTKALNPFVPSKALSSFTVSTENATMVGRTLTNLEFKAILEGAILRVVVNGTLTNQ